MTCQSIIPTFGRNSLSINIFTVTQFVSEGLKRRRTADAINQIYHMTPYSSVLLHSFGKIWEKYIAYATEASNRLATVLRILVDVPRNSSLILRDGIRQEVSFKCVHLRNGFLDQIWIVWLFLSENLIGSFLQCFVLFDIKLVNWSDAKLILS